MLKNRSIKREILNCKRYIFQGAKPSYLNVATSVLTPKNHTFQNEHICFPTRRARIFKSKSISFRLNRDLFFRRFAITLEFSIKHLRIEKVVFVKFCKRYKLIQNHDLSRFLHKTAQVLQKCEDFLAKKCEI